MSFELDKEEDELMSDINVTPMVDVMLVLLILFIVTLPMVTNNITVSLPEADAEQNQDSEAVVVTVNSSGDIIVDGRTMSTQELQALLLEDSGGVSGVNIFGDGSVAYSEIVKVMSVVNSSGIDNIGFITVPTK